MNIFVLDSNIKLCAQYHCNKHVVKMILESAQLLSSAYTLEDVSSLGLYKRTHYNHPCSIWARSSYSNWKWLLMLAKELCVEYTYRYERIHKTQAIIDRMYKNPVNLPNIELTKFAICMPDEYKVECPIQSYRNYYKHAKSTLLKYKNRDIPEFLK